MGYGIAVDAHGSAYVTGATYSPDFSTKNGFQTVLKGIGKAFVAKFNSDGELIYSTYLGGSGLGDEGYSIAVDRHENAYVTGYTSSFDFPIRNAFQNVPKAFQTAFVTKLDSSGTELVYSTYLGGSGNTSFGDTGAGIAVDAHENAYVTGVTASVDFPTKNAFQTRLKGLTDAFVTKFDAAGDMLVYSTYLGVSTSLFDPFDDLANAIAVDAHGNAYITGRTASPDFPVKNAFQGPAGSRQAFVTKFDAAGNALIYSSYLAEYWDAGIVVDRKGDAYVTGFYGVFVDKVSAR